ncbi:hypothetical protein [Aulosira sp. FACHB-615]|uniref:hypothetical protein n=1 Tax=Aulosira sp. FACHB-615 TaxID=2692777 RepID=UPI0016888176|nr:hypothetical protein [Aulosira sp. FACHB-615]MBD2486352.1 hypothetical protein [Aulosira sp. FACHB-615]
MSDREIEILYWRISLLLVLISPWCIYSLKIAKVTFAYNFFIYTLLPFLSIPIQLIVVIALVTVKEGKVPTKFWLIEPSAYSQNEIKANSLKSCITNISNKLNNLGFQFEILEDGDKSSCIAFRKEKDKRVLNFLGHAFSGKINLENQQGYLIKLEANIILHDTLLIETGELSKIQEICNSLCLKRKSQETNIKHKDFPFVLSCGVTMSFITVIVSVFNNLWYVVNNAWLFGVSTTAIGTILLTLFYLQKKQLSSFRYRLVFTGLYLGSIPYIAWITNIKLG